MDRWILVVYASEFGATRRVAEAIGEVLRDAATMVDVRPVVEVNDVAPYQAVVIGSAIYNGQWLPEAVHFVQYHEAALSQVPVAYFAVSMTMRTDTVENRRTVLGYLEPVRTAAPRIKPVDIGLFAGKMDYGNLPLLTRVVFWLRSRLPTGDFRDWDAIQVWATKLRPALIGDPRM